MKAPLPPGYVRLESVISVDVMFAHQTPREEIQHLIADRMGAMLSGAIRTGEMDTTMPIFIDAAQRADRYAFDTWDVHEVKLRLDYAYRSPMRPAIRARDDAQPELDQPRKALDG